MIADDLTGALDTGVAFASVGISTCVGPGDYFLNNPEADACTVQVSVVESRHMPKEQAYQMVYELVRKAQDCSFSWIYKKTDSALRGNIGAELAALRSASEEKRLYFVPAYPRMGRITQNGIHYINGETPVSESVFGTDPFNPVRYSAVQDVIRETAAVNTVCADISMEEYPEGISIFDAATDEEMYRIARHLTKRPDARLYAGCAGFANVLREVLELPKETGGFGGCPGGNLTVFCGSINPISLAQCRKAVQNGAPHFRLMRDGAYVPEATLIEGIADSSTHAPVTVFDTGSAEVELGGDGELIAQKVSHVIRGVLDSRPDTILFVIGGDTLIAFIKNLEIDLIFPLGELFPGVVLSRYRYKGEWRFLLSKSGGFGEEDLLQKIYEKINQREKKNGGCI